jgi:hypothetical protein
MNVAHGDLYSREYLFKGDTNENEVEEMMVNWR